jgi:hypothetical protein
MSDDLQKELLNLNKETISQGKNQHETGSKHNILHATFA